MMEFNGVLFAGTAEGEEADATVGVGTIIVGEDVEVDEEPSVKLSEGAPKEAILIGTVGCSILEEESDTRKG